MLVVTRPRIDSLETVRHELPDGLTLRDYVESAAMPPEVWTQGVALTGDQVWFPEEWHLVRPKPGVPVNIGLVPAKGGAGSILSVGLLGLQLFAGSVNPFLGALVGIGGQMLLSALAPIPETPQAENRKTKQIGQGGFAGNVLKKWDQIPTVLGKKRIAPVLLMPVWNDTQGDNIYTTGVIGLAGRHAISEIRINGTEPPADAELTIREGSTTDAGLSILTTTQWQTAGKILPRHAYQSDLSNDKRYKLQHSGTVADVVANDLPQETKYRLGNSPDRVILDFQFPRGLARNDGDVTRAGIALRLVLYDEDGTSVVFPEFHLQAALLVPIRTKLIIEWEPDPGSGTTPGGSNLWCKAFASTSGMVSNGTVADAYFGSSAAADNVRVSADKTNITVYLDPDEIPKGNYTLGIKVGAGYRSNRMNLVNNKYQFNGAAETTAEHFSYYADGGEHYSAEDQAIMNTDLELTYITPQWDEEPFDPAGLCTIEFRIKNLQVDSLSVVAERYVRHRWDGSSWVVGPHVSANPAELMYEVLTDAALNSRPLDTSIIDSAELGAWASWCDTNFKRCNAYVEGGTVEEALEYLVHAGHAALRRSETWSVYIDNDKSAETAVQTYSPRNTRDFQVERSFDNHPHGLKITFDDEDDEFQTAERIVYADGYSDLNATLIDARQSKSITKAVRIDQRFRQDLRAMRYRLNVYSFLTDLQYLMSDRGSVVNLNTDVISAIYGFARIIEVHRQDVSGVTKIVALTLDDALPMRTPEGNDIFALSNLFEPADIFNIAIATGIAIQARDGDETLGQTSQTGHQKFIQFTTPLTDDTEIVEGCLVVAGTVGSVSRRCIVLNVEPGPDLTARLTLIDEAPEIFA